MRLILDSNFLISLEREARRKVLGAASLFLEEHAKDALFTTYAVTGELACGRSVVNRTHWQQLCRFYPVIAWNTEVSWQYGEIFRELQAKGTPIGTNDLWIAATALVHHMGAVTRNLDEFRRVPGLIVIPY